MAAAAPVTPSPPWAPGRMAQRALVRSARPWRGERRRASTLSPPTALGCPSGDSVLISSRQAAEPGDLAPASLIVVPRGCAFADTGDLGEQVGTPRSDLGELSGGHGLLRPRRRRQRCHPAETEGDGPPGSTASSRPPGCRGDRAGTGEVMADAQLTLRVLLRASLSGNLRRRTT
jgi:hypothetical protein